MITIDEAAKIVRDLDNINNERIDEIVKGIATSVEFPNMIVACFGDFMERLQKNEPNLAPRQLLSRVLSTFATTCIEIGMVYQQRKDWDASVLHPKPN